MTVAAAGPAALPLVHVEHCMGTVFSFHVPPPGVERRIVDAAVAWLHHVDATLSPYLPTSEVSRINAGSLAVAHASPQLRAIVEACDRLRGETDGYFSAYPNGHSLDPCGYVKGWALNRVAALLDSRGAANYCVNGGGDVACAGQPEPGRGWRIGIADPRRRNRLLTSFEVCGPVAVATSGLAERGAHILDPHTGRPVTELASVTVVARDIVTADVYATAAVAMGLTRGRTWLATKPAVRALLVDQFGTQHYVGQW